MNDTNQSYKVSASSHIACVAFTINTEIPADKVVEVLADGVLYNTQRAAASKAVKPFGSKRGEIAFSPKVEAAVREALEALFPNAEITTREHVKGATITKKFAATRSVIADKLTTGTAVEEIAERAGFAGDIEDEDGEYTTEFLVAVEARIKKLAASI